MKHTVFAAETPSKFGRRDRVSMLPGGSSRATCGELRADLLKKLEKVYDVSWPIPVGSPPDRGAL